MPMILLFKSNFWGKNFDETNILTLSTSFKSIPSCACSESRVTAKEGTKMSFSTETQPRTNALDIVRLIKNYFTNFLMGSFWFNESKSKQCMTVELIWLMTAIRFPTVACCHVNSAPTSLRIWLVNLNRTHQKLSKILKEKSWSDTWRWATHRCAIKTLNLFFTVKQFGPKLYQNKILIFPLSLYSD